MPKRELQRRVTPQVSGGRVDTNTADQFGESLIRAVDNVRARRSFKLVVDLSQITFMSSSGLRELNRAQKHANARGGRIILDMVCENISDKLKLTGFDEVLPQKRPARANRR